MRSRRISARRVMTMAGFAIFGLCASPKLAHADVSSWFFAGGGAASLERHGASDQYGALRLQLGMGSPPDAPIVVGGVAHSLSFFGAGTDLALTARAATGGFVRGDWGVALDAGGYRRWWGVGSTGFLGSVVLGAPFGLQAVLDFEKGTSEAQAFAAFVGIDFLRLTVYRTVGTSFIPNPNPAVR